MSIRRVLRLLAETVALTGLHDRSTRAEETFANYDTKSGFSLKILNPFETILIIVGIYAL